MKPNKIAMKTMAMKCKVANFLRKELYEYSDSDYVVKYKKKKPLAELNSKEFVKKLFPFLREMNSELSAYKRKRQDKADLLEKRLNSPQTKSMKKKLGLIPKVLKINLVNSEK